MFQRLLCATVLTVAAIPASLAWAAASTDGYQSPAEGAAGLGLTWAYLAAAVAAIVVLGFKNAKRAPQG